MRHLLSSLAAAVLCLGAFAQEPAAPAKPVQVEKVQVEKQCPATGQVGTHCPGEKACSAEPAQSACAVKATVAQETCPIAKAVLAVKAAAKTGCCQEGAAVKTATAKAGACATSCQEGAAVKTTVVAQECTAVCSGEKTAAKTSCCQEGAAVKTATAKAGACATSCQDGAAVKTSEKASGCCSEGAAVKTGEKTEECSGSCSGEQAAEKAGCCQETKALLTSVKAKKVVIEI
jgi:hypothetical protein